VRDDEQAARDAAMTTSGTAWWLGTPLGLLTLWLVADSVVSAFPGTAVVVGLVALGALAGIVGLLWFVASRG
jgi:hypothetical protein